MALRPALELRAKKARLVGAVLGSFGFVAFCTIALLNAPFGWFEKGAMVLGILTFGTFAIVGIARLLKPAQHIRLDEIGIHTDGVPGAAPMTVRWEDLRSIRTWEMERQRMVVLDITDLAPAYAAAAPTGRTVMKMNEGLAGSPIVLHPPSFGYDVDAFVNELQEWLSDQGFASRSVDALG